MLVRLSPKGCQRVDACMVAVVERECELLTPLGAVERAELADLLRTLLLAVESLKAPVAGIEW